VIGSTDYLDNTVNAFAIKSYKRKVFNIDLIISWKKKPDTEGVPDSKYMIKEPTMKA